MKPFPPAPALADDVHFELVEEDEEVKELVVVPGYVRADGTRVGGYSYHRDDGGRAAETLGGGADGDEDLLVNAGVNDYAVKRAEKMIAKVVHLPRPGPIVVPLSQEEINQEMGALDGQYDWVGDRIKINGEPPGDNQTYTIIHESGHWLDLRGRLTEVAIRDDLRKTIENSDGIRKWKRAAQGTPGSYAAAWGEYMSRDLESFARAWEQYILTEGGTKPRATEFGYDRDQRGPGHFWTAKDFAPIAKGFDRLIKEQGWQPA